MDSSAENSDTTDSTEKPENLVNLEEPNDVMEQDNSANPEEPDDVMEQENYDKPDSLTMTGELLEEVTEASDTVKPLKESHSARRPLEIPVKAENEKPSDPSGKSKQPQNETLVRRRKSEGDVLDNLQQKRLCLRPRISDHLDPQQLPAPIVIVDAPFDPTPPVSPEHLPDPTHLQIPKTIIYPAGSSRLGTWKRRNVSSISRGTLLNFFRKWKTKLGCTRLIATRMKAPTKESSDSGPREYDDDFLLTHLLDDDDNDDDEDNQINLTAVEKIRHLELLNIIKRKCSNKKQLFSTDRPLYVQRPEKKASILKPLLSEPVQGEENEDWYRRAKETQGEPSTSTGVRRSQYSRRQHRSEPSRKCLETTLFVPQYPYEQPDWDMLFRDANKSRESNEESYSSETKFNLNSEKMSEISCVPSSDVAYGAADSSDSCSPVEDSSSRQDQQSTELSSSSRNPSSTLFETARGSSSSEEQEQLPDDEDQDKNK